LNPTREVYWNIGNAWALYLLLAPALVVFVCGLWKHVRLWKVGKPGKPAGSTFERLKSLLVYGFGHARIARQRYAGLFHGLFFFGFGLLFIGTLVVWVHEDFGLKIMQGPFYLYFQSLTLDIAGLATVVGLTLALVRRLFFQPKRLENSWKDWVALPLMLAILLTGFTLEGLRQVATQDPWASWSPVGLVFGHFFAAILPAAALRPLHATLWWTHMAMVFSLIAWMPYSKLLHMVTASANIYWRSLDPKGAIVKPIDLETAETFGVRSIDQFSWKSLLDLDACTECGRCQDACPAYATGKPLSPKKLVLDLRGHLREQGPKILDGAVKVAPEGLPIVDNVISEETLWACTNCRACMEACPVFIDHVPKILDLRRQLVMEEGRVPDTMQAAMRSLETRGHPFAGATATRLDWCKDLGVKIAAESEEPTEYLYWVGCATALNPRNQKVAQAFAGLMQQAGVDFSILGNEEACTGDAARRMGNEYLFQSMARRNIEVLQSRQVKKIVTTCPHCLNSFKNEYPQFGGQFEVIHHSQLLSDLIDQGRLKPAAGAAGKITFHDPCHLGRYNEVYDEPRAVIDVANVGERVEMPRHRQNSFCCGAGGGRMFAEEPIAQRVGNVRAREALETGSDKLGVGCPFCMLMLEEGVKSEAKEGREMRVLDIAEVLQGS
jgi:Fe-S oxidoreductase/nitrate reductase gamma subunit